MISTTEPDTTESGGALPPYSGDDSLCPKCLSGEAITWYRPAMGFFPAHQWNGGLRRGPQPERLERECARCAFKWDEALVTDSPGMTVDALAHALHNSTPYPVELDRQVREFMARELLLMLHVTARPNHPVWQYSDGRPPATQATPAGPEICEVLHQTPDEESR